MYADRQLVMIHVTAVENQIMYEVEGQRGDMSQHVKVHVSHSITTIAGCITSHWCAVGCCTYYHLDHTFGDLYTEVSCCWLR